MAVKQKTSKKEVMIDEIRAKLYEFEVITAKAEKLMAKHGITEMLAQAAEIKKNAVELAVKHGIEQIPGDHGSYYGLRRDAYNKRVVGDDEELAEVKDPTAVIPLKTIIKSKFGKKWLEIWKSVTTRRVDVGKLENAVKSGVLTVKEIQPAYYQDTKAPYLRKYGG